MHHLTCNISVQFVDINECIQDLSECDNNAQCTDTIGSYNCTCNSGYEGSGFTCMSKLYIIHIRLIEMYIYCKCYAYSALDIDECAINAHNCDENANCTDTDGSFECTCVSGYMGNGILCQSKNFIDTCMYY